VNTEFLYVFPSYLQKKDRKFPTNQCSFTMAEFSNRSRSDVESEAECQSVWSNAGEVQTVPLQLDETNK